VLQRHSYFAILSAAGNSHEVYGATSPKAMGSMCQNYVAREFLTACWENSLFRRTWKRWLKNFQTTRCQRMRKPV